MEINKQAASRVDRTIVEKMRKVQFVLIILFLSFFILTFIGAGNLLVISVVGLLLCLTGMLETTTEVDLWIFIPLTLYTVLSLLSGYRTYGSTLDGLSTTQAIFPVIYLLTACLNNANRVLLKLLCTVWIGLIAAGGIVQFTIEAFLGTADRLSGLLGNPNATGILLVLGWFAQQSCLIDLHGTQHSRLQSVLNALGFLMLAALALTLSIGAFGALAIGMIAMSIYGKEKASTFFCRAAEVIFAIGSGILLYIAGDYAGTPWIALLMVFYLLAAAILQNALRQCLQDFRWLRVLILLVGVSGTAGLLFLRPNAVATFTERLTMIQHALRYLGREPLLGIGPYQWRRYNLQDADPYFNTWHIHNIFVHVGVELGLPAMGMLIFTAIRHACKRENKAQRGAFFAALIHNLMDTSFFYISTVPLLMMTAAKDERKTHTMHAVTVKCIFGAFGILFAWNTMHYLW